MASPSPREQGRLHDELWRRAYGDMQAAGPVHRHMRRLLAEALADLDFRTAVDVGCGAGHNAALLSSGGADRLVGIDISDEALDRARRRACGEYHTLDIQAAALEEQFDLVFSSLLLEHLPEDMAALANMRAMCGRWLVASTIAGDFERYRAWDERVGHVRNYQRGELEARLAASGFEVVRSLYWGYPFYTPLARTFQNFTRPTAEFGVLSKFLARLLYRLYYLNSSHRGDLLIVVARAVTREQPRP